MLTLKMTLNNQILLETEFLVKNKQKYVLHYFAFFALFAL